MTPTIPAAIEATTRSAGIVLPVTAPKVDLRDTPSKMGQPSTVSSRKRRTASRFCALFLPKPKPGSIKSLWRSTPAASAISIDRDKEGEDVGDDVQLRVDARAIVHQYDRSPGVRHDAGHLAVMLKAPDVVDDGGARFDGGGGDARLHRIDGNRRRDPAPKLRDHRDHAGKLLVRRNRDCAGPGRLAADIQNAGALRLEAHAMFHRGRGRRVNAAVGERIRGNVHDPHNGDR